MKFEYAKVTYPPSEAFPRGASSFRPTINIAIRHGNRRLRVFALLDTGAEFCLLPRWMGEQLGIAITEGKKTTFKGAAGGTQIAYFHNIIFEIGGWDHRCRAGFIYEAEEELPFALLGTIGFFDSYKATFNVQKNEIRLDKIN